MIRLLGLAAITVAGGVGCGLNQSGVSPPPDDIFFPAGTLVDQSGRWLYVSNSNSDLRYNDGTLLAVDLQKVAQDRSRVWDSCPRIGYVRPSSERDTDYCCWDALDREVLNCDVRKYVDAAATVRIGSFSGAMVWQRYCDPAAMPSRAGCSDPDPNRGRLLVPVRGNSSITVVETKIDPAAPDASVKLRCTGSDPNVDPPDFAACDEAHRVVQAIAPDSAPTSTNPTVIRLPEEPYALAIDPVLQLLYVGHLRGGKVSLIDIGGTSSAQMPMPMPTLIAPFGSIFPPDGNGLSGVTSLTLRPNDSSRAVYMTSRYLPRAGAMVPTAVDLLPSPLTFRNIALVGAGETFITNLAGSELRGIQFLPDAPRAFVLQRSPPALVGFDLTPNAEGRAQAVPTDVLETCSSPTFLDSYNAGSAGLRLFVTCYEGGQVYVFDPYVPRLVTIIEVGRGPAGLAFPPFDPTVQNVFAYVTGFGANNVSVVDLQPGSLTEYRVVQRIGFPSPVPR